MKVAVLGAGAWGTALAVHLSRMGHEVRVWGHDADHLATIAKSGSNLRYLPGVAFPEGLLFESRLRSATQGVEAVVVAVPSSAFRRIAFELEEWNGLWISVTKGIEDPSGQTMCQVLRERAPQASIVALSGPSLALEVAQGIPTAVVAASADAEAARRTQSLFHSTTFRVYTCADQLGVELGGALKNVIAIAAGVCDGLSFGDNSKAALVTRGIAEMRRLGVACGARPETFAGLSGLGDLTVTCFSKKSRNRGFGERLGRGESVQSILQSTVSVAEGVPTALSAWHLSHRLSVPTPIIDEVHALLYQHKDPRQALRDLMHREHRAEED